MIHRSGYFVLVLCANAIFANATLAQVNNGSAPFVASHLENRETLVDSIIQKQIDQQGLVGVCVGLIIDREVSFLKGYGFEDRENSIPANRHSMFRWASISKPVTAIAAMQLVEQGKLSLDDDVRKYVPEFPDHGPLIRVRDLMCHQSGIVHYRNGREQ